MSALLRKSLYFASLSIAIALIFNRIFPAFAQQATGSIKFGDFYPPTIILSPTRSTLVPSNTPVPTNTQTLTITPIPTMTLYNWGNTCLSSTGTTLPFDDSPYWDDPFISGSNCERCTDCRIVQGPTANYNCIEIKPCAQLTPSPTPIETPEPTQADQDDQGERNAIYFSQRDSAWASYPGKYPDIRRCGCGPTTVAQILAGYFDKIGNPRKGRFNPPEVWDMVMDAGSSPVWCGVDVPYLLAVLKDHDLDVTRYFYPSTNKYLVEKEFKEWIDEGYYVIALAKVNGGGHYVLVTDVDNKDRVWVFDPYYGYGASDQPTLIASDHEYTNFYSYLVVPR